MHAYLQLLQIRLFCGQPKNASATAEKNLKNQSNVNAFAATLLWCHMGMFVSVSVHRNVKPPFPSQKTNDTKRGK